MWLDFMVDGQRTLLHIAEDKGHDEIAGLSTEKGIEKVPRESF